VAKYWIKTEQVVEGPYESGLLRYLPGFKEDTLVSPDEIPEEIWTKAVETEGFQSLFQAASFSAQTASRTLNPDSPSPEIALDPSLDKTIASLSEVKEVPIMTNSNSGLLEAMDKISKEIRETEGKTLESPLSPSYLKPDKKILGNETVQKPVPGAVFQNVPIHSFKNSQPTIKRFGTGKRILVVLGCFFVLAAGGGWIFRNRIADLVRKSKEVKLNQNKPEMAGSYAKDQKPESAVPSPPAKVLIQPLKPKVKVTVRPKLLVKNRFKPSRKIRAETEAELKSQKYILPGVPSPNITSAKIQKDPSVTEQKAEVVPESESSQADTPSPTHRTSNSVEKNPVESKQKAEVAQQEGLSQNGAQDEKSKAGKDEPKGQWFSQDSWGE